MVAGGRVADDESVLERAVSEPAVSEWALATFGDRALPVRRAVVEALLVALNDAQDAQQTSHASTRHPFGATLMARKYEVLAEKLADMDGVRVTRLAGSAFSLVIVGRNMLLPFRYAKDATVPIQQARLTDGQVSGRMRLLFSRFGPHPLYIQESLLPDDTLDDDEEILFANLPDETRLIVIPFACNEQAGLINAWWGEASLDGVTGELNWIRPPEQLPLRAQPFGAVRPEPAAMFDSGELPGLVTRPRETPRTGTDGQAADS
jgi:hypothetical protein